MLRGVLVLAGMVVLGTAVLLVASLAAMIGFGLGPVVMPWLMPLLWLLSRRKRKRGELPGPGPERASPVERRGDRWMRTGRGPVPAH